MSRHRPDAAGAAISTSTLVLLGVVIVVVYGATIGFFALAEPDEARYAEIPREMLQRGDWVTPYLNYVKYFEKPPLLYWLVALTYGIFGFSEFTARLWPLLFALVGMAVVFVVGSSMRDRRYAATAVVILATSPFYFGLSQVLTLDMPLSGLMTLSLGSFWMAYADLTRRPRWLILFYAALALAVLTKGPVALLLVAAVLGSFVLLRWEWSILRWALSPIGIIIFLAVAAPWHVLVSQRNPEFFEYYVFDQHLKRYLSPAEHQQPLWYFLPVVLGGAAPWTILLLFVPGAWRDYLTNLVRCRVSAATLFCTLWALMIFTFFSLSGSKLPTYVLPMFPPLALLMAAAIEGQLKHDSRLFAAGGSGLMAFGALMLVSGLVVAEVVDDPNGATIASRLAMAAVPLLLLGGLVRRLQRRGDSRAAFLALASGVLAVQLVAISGRHLAQDYRALGLTIAAQATPQDLVVSYRHYTQAIPLYSQHRTILVGARGELTFGSRIGDQSEYFWDKDARLISQWAAPQRLFLVINRSELESLQASLSPAPRQIAAYRKKVVIVNFPAAGATNG